MKEKLKKRKKRNAKQKERRKKDKEEKDKKMGILYSYIVKDVVDEMKLSCHPSRHPSKQNKYIF